MTTTEKPTSKKPTHIAYQIRDTKNGKGYFNRIGVAFAHKDNMGFDVLLECVPLDGRISLRTFTEKAENAETSQKVE